MDICQRQLSEVIDPVTMFISKRTVLVSVNKTDNFVFIFFKFKTIRILIRKF